MSRNFLCPTNLDRYVPKKKRANMLAITCHQPPWIKRLVTMVHGCCRKLAGCKPKRRIRLGAIIVAINNRKFTPIKTHTGVSLKLWYLLYVITLFTPNLHY